MATQTEQQSALKDAMARANEVALKIAPPGPGEFHAIETVGMKRGGNDLMGTEPLTKKAFMDHNDSKLMAQQVANTLVSQRNTGPMLVEEVRVPTNIIGLVIGKGGDMIKKIEQDTGAKLQVASEEMGPPHERSITVTGTAEAVNQAKLVIMEIENGGGKVPEHLAPGLPQGEFQIEMMIATRKVGLVIGQKGATIKDLQNRSGCRINVQQDDKNQNVPEKMLRICGEQTAVMYAKQLVMEILSSREPIEAVRNQRPPPHQQQQGYSEITPGGGGGGGGGGGYMEMDVPRDAVGMIIGAKGSMVQRLQQETGCRVQFKNEMQGPMKTAMLRGTPEQMAAAQERIKEIVESAPEGKAPFRGGPTRHSQGGGGGGGGGGQRHFTPQPTAQPQQVIAGGALGIKNMIVKVPAVKCGYVIGKAGENIKAMKAETKINIQIDRTVPESSPFRVFKMSGDDEGIRRAMDIIRHKVQDPTLEPEMEDGSPATVTYVTQGGAPAVVVAQPGQPQLQQPAYQIAYQQPQVQQQAAQLYVQQQQQLQQLQLQQLQQQQQQVVQVASSAQTSQLYAQSQASATTATSQAAAAALQPGTAEYNNAWTAYYQQQQVYQQYIAQQQAGGATVATVGTAGSVVAGLPAGMTVVAAAPQVVASDPSQQQAGALAQYQAQLAQYQTQYVQQPQ